MDALAIYGFSWTNSKSFWQLNSCIFGGDGFLGDGILTGWGSGDACMAVPVVTKTFSGIFG
jgi:hypothetical protein